MNFSIKYTTTFLMALIIATGCDLANTNMKDQVDEHSDRVVFLSNMKGTYDLFTANPDGSAKKQITSNNFTESMPSISPDGTKVAYIIMGQIWTMNINGNRLLGTTDEGVYSDPSWSSDGKRIAYSLEGDIFIMNADGSAPKNITNTIDIEEYAPKWSPEGVEIAFTRYTQDAAGNSLDTEIILINTETLEQTQLTDNEVEDEYAAWSPDGSELVLYGTDAEGTPNLYTINTNGENRTLFTDLGRDRIDDQAKPCWGADNYIYFTRISTGIGSAKAKSDEGGYNSSRSNKLRPLVEDVVTGGDNRGVTCLTRKLDKETSK